MANNWANGETIIETSNDYLGYWVDAIGVLTLSYVAPGGGGAKFPTPHLWWSQEA